MSFCRPEDEVCTLRQYSREVTVRGEFDNGRRVDRASIVYDLSIHDRADFGFSEEGHLTYWSRFPP